MLQKQRKKFVLTLKHCSKHSQKHYISSKKVTPSPLYPVFHLKEHCYLQKIKKFILIAMSYSGAKENVSTHLHYHLQISKCSGLVHSRLILSLSRGNNIDSGTTRARMESSYDRMEGMAEERRVKRLTITSIWPRSCHHFNAMARSHLRFYSSLFDELCRTMTAFWEWNWRQPLRTIEGCILRDMVMRSLQRLRNIC